MVSAVIFDIGGVYLRGSFFDFMDRSYALLVSSKLCKYGDQIVFDRDYNKGLISADECFGKVFGPMTSEQLAQIKRMWTQTWSPDPEMVDLVRRLQQRYTVAVLSNSDKLNSDLYWQRGWYAPFSVVVLSHELHMLKPDRPIYDHILHQLKLPAQECVFIDDQKMNLDTAKQLGMRVIHHKSAQQTEKMLRKLCLAFD